MPLFSFIILMDMTYSLMIIFSFLNYYNLYTCQPLILMNKIYQNPMEVNEFLVSSLSFILMISHHYLY